MSKRQSIWGRALADSNKIREYIWWFIAVELIAVAMGGAAGIWLTPDDARKWETAFYPAFGAIAGGLTVLLLLVVFNLALAPIRQRNEAWMELDTIDEVQPHQARLRIRPITNEYFVHAGRALTIKVLNDGPGAAKSVRVRVLDFAPRNKTFDEFTCRTEDGANAYNEADINSGDSATFDLVQYGVSHSREGYSFHAAFLGSNYQGFELVDNVPYFIDLRITGQNAVEPIPLRLKLELDAKKDNEKGLMVTSVESLQQ
jgi:hypothetical protein